jgi:uncharacterized membrane protein YvbJ
VFCQKCGAENKNDAKFCDRCGASMQLFPVAPPQETPFSSKHNTVIAAKIATKKQQIKDISQIGPVILVILGILICLTIVGIILGLILIGIAIWWSSSRENEKKKLQSEIKELEAELE